ncbi:MAG TPA: L-lactate permease [Chthoniobacterales bacterium]|jgi:lactate permease|nr:L-lactate permease [Chthoniobacterales bacterium]
MDLFFAALPIGFLIFVMTKKNGLPSTIAFALAALTTYVIRIAYFKTSLPLSHAAIVNGLLQALTPISIVFGAIFFFVALERSGAMQTLRLWLDGVSRNPVAQLMIVGWSFIFLIEGASGFGTPAALAAPILVGLGFPPLRVAVLCIIMNAVPTSFGAVGTPTWFGLGSLGLSESQLLEIGLKAALIHAVAALIIPVIALRFVVDWKEIRRNLLFVELAVLASVVPMTAVASFSYEFPSVVGGMVGLLITIFLARCGIGLAKEEANAASLAAPSSQSTSPQPSEASALSPGAVLRALAPLLATVGILLVTRIPFFGLRQLLTSEADWVSISLGPVGVFSLSPSLVFQLRGIFGQDLHWSYALLYVPFILPFFVAAALALILYRCPPAVFGQVAKETFARLRNPVIALFGALIFVQLLTIGGQRASTRILGDALASGTGDLWIYFAGFLGALGSFFSGSNTISNLTFGPIQLRIAQDLGLSSTTMLALQTVGAAMGNMVAVHNIVAVCAVLGLKDQEGAILKKTFIPTLVYGIILAALAGIWFAVS